MAETAKKETFIYVIGAHRGPKKVGLAANPLARMRSIQTGNGKDVALLHTVAVPVETASMIERRAHWLLRDTKVCGEWFDVSESVAKKSVDQAVAERGEGEKERPAVGRPPLKLKDPTVKTTLRLPTSLLERVKLVAGDGDASEVIRSGIEAEVRRRERLPRKPPSVSKDGES